VTYRTELTPAAARDLRKLPRDVLRRVHAVLVVLSETPRPPKAQRLVGELREYLRVRVGDFRIVYLVDDDRLVVCVIRVRHRKDVYR